MAETEVQVGGERYRIGRLPPITQFHLVRRMGSALVGGLGAHLGRQATAAEMIVPVMEAVSKLSDEDSEYIINTCLGAMTRHQAGSDAWAPVLVARRLMFEDITMPLMLELTFKVLEAQLDNFFPSAAPKASGAPRAASGPRSRAVSSS